MHSCAQLKVLRETESGGMGTRWQFFPACAIASSMRDIGSRAVTCLVPKPLYGMLQLKNSGASLSHEAPCSSRLMVSSSPHAKKSGATTPPAKHLAEPSVAIYGGRWAHEEADSMLRPIQKQRAMELSMFHRAYSHSADCFLNA